MIIVGGISNFDSAITSNVEIGLYNNKPHPFLVSTQYYHESKQQPKPTTPSNNLAEIIEEVIDDSILESTQTGMLQVPVKHLITRQVGAAQGKRPETRISLVYEKNENIRLWSPLYEELLEMFKDLYNQQPNGRSHLTNIKRISEQLAVSKDLPSGIGSYGDDYFGVKRPKFNDYIPTSAFYALIKHIMISEDKNYSSTAFAGRYMTINAFFEYVTTGISLNNLLIKYQIQ